MESTAILETKLDGLQTEMKAILKQQETATGEKFTSLGMKLDALQRQADAIDVRISERHAAGGTGQRSLADLLMKNDDFLRLQRDRKGTFILNLKGADCALLERKTVVDSAALGAQATGVLQIDRMPGVTSEPRETLRLRNLLTSRPTSLQVIDFVKVNSPMTNASPQQGDGHTKKEAGVTFTSSSEKVQTIAHWLPCSRQALDDAADLANFINDSLRFYVDQAEEVQMLYGVGGAVDLHGLITQATQFTVGLLGTQAWTKIDVVGACVEQLTTAKELQPDFIVMHPVDWWSILRTKDSQGHYLLGDPGSIARPRLWNLDVVPSTNIVSGQFLVGTGNPEGVVIRDRQEMQVEISTSHEDYWARNLLAVRAEKRVALIVRRPGSFLTGTFSTSPSS